MVESEDGPACIADRPIWQSWIRIHVQMLARKLSSGSRTNFGTNNDCKACTNMLIFSSFDWHLPRRGAREQMMESDSVGHKRATRDTIP